MKLHRKENPDRKPSLPEMPRIDRTLLATAYTAGLIAAWKWDGGGSYSLTLTSRTVEHVEVALLTGYLESLKAAA